MNILLIQGGWSVEREVSLKGCQAVLQSLERLGHEVIVYDPGTDMLAQLPEIADRVDFAFIGLHGSPGEDGLIQALLERLDIPYQGADAGGSLLALDKNASKALFRKWGLPLVPSVLLTQRPPSGWLPPFALPAFIKANNGGSSLNLEQITKASELEGVLERLFSFGTAYLLEQAVSGVEVTCGVLGELRDGKECPRALPPILIKAHSVSGVFDYKSKYTVGGAEEICPAPLAPELNMAIQDLALQAHRVLGLSGYSRSDFILQDTGQPIILETNTLPGMTGTSLIPQEAAAAGISFDELIERLIVLGLARSRR